MSTTKLKFLRKHEGDGQWLLVYLSSLLGHHCWEDFAASWLFVCCLGWSEGTCTVKVNEMIHFWYNIYHIVEGTCTIKVDEMIQFLIHPIKKFVVIYDANSCWIVTFIKTKKNVSLYHWQNLKRYSFPLLLLWYKL